MNRSRRVCLLAGVLTLLAPRRLRAQPALERDHRPTIDAPTLSEDPGAVPLQVSVNHPMEPDHFIRSIEVRLDNDPVPDKGKFLFTPANGQAAVAFQMRSGSGGLLKVTAECKGTSSPPRRSGSQGRMRRPCRPDSRPPRQPADPSARIDQARRGRADPRQGLVRNFRRLTACSPAVRISRATRWRPTWKPPATSSAWTRGAPYVPRDSR